jgi:hypothetical protein
MISKQVNIEILFEYERIFNIIDNIVVLVFLVEKRNLLKHTIENYYE